MREEKSRKRGRPSPRPLPIGRGANTLRPRTTYSPSLERRGQGWLIKEGLEVGYFPGYSKLFSHEEGHHQGHHPDGYCRSHGLAHLSRCRQLPLASKESLFQYREGLFYLFVRIDDLFGHGLHGFTRIFFVPDRQYSTIFLTSGKWSYKGLLLHVWASQRCSCVQKQ